MMNLQDLLGTSLPDTLLIVDRSGTICDACLGTDGQLFDAPPAGRRLSELWPEPACETVLRETRKVLKSRRPQSAWLRMPAQADAVAGDGQREWELRFRAHGRERVLILARPADSLAAAGTAGELLADSPDRDPDTGLRTRRWLLRQAGDLFNEARLREDSVAIAVVEMPSLDTINAAFGRTMGARILRAAAERIGARVRRRRSQDERDEIALLARDALALLIPSPGSPEALSAVIERVADTLRSPYAIDGREFSITSQIGVSVFPRDGSSPEALLQNAHAALCDRTQQQIRRPSFFSDSMPNRSLAQLDVQEELRLAIEHDQLSVRYSPVADAQSGQVIALEVRPVLESPLRGEIGTARLVSFAESTGLSTLLFYQMLDHALDQVPTLLGTDALTHAAVRVAVRAGQLDERLPGELARRCRERQLAPEQICITAPESTVVRSDTAEVLTALGRMGIQVMLREFGAERIRLTDLAAQRLRGVQLSNALVQQLRSQSGRRMCRAIADFIHALDMRVGAGSVDDSQEVALLLGFGCDEFAGPLLGEAMTREALEALLRFQREFARGAGDALASQGGQ